MKTIILALGVLTLTIGFIGCGGTATNANNANAKPANANTNAATPASSPASSNSNANADKKDTASNPELDFELVNKTGYDIKAVSVGPTGDKNWTKDDELDLKGAVVKNGESVKVKFSPKEKAEKWDLKIEWTDGDPSVEWIGFDLTTIETITLHYDKASGKTTAESK